MHKLPSLRFFLPCLSSPPPFSISTPFLYPVRCNFLQIRSLNNARFPWELYAKSSDFLKCRLNIANPLFFFFFHDDNTISQFQQSRSITSDRESGDYTQDENKIGDLDERDDHLEIFRIHLRHLVVGRGKQVFSRVYLSNFESQEFQVLDSRVEKCRSKKSINLPDAALRHPDAPSNGSLSRSDP